MDYDDTGKVSFDHIYDQPDPRAYFGTLCRLGYCIPQLASPYFARLLTSSPTAQQRQQLAATDLIISTGCIGYVTSETITRVLDANDGRRPWMAHFVLRMFPFGPVADCLAGYGYETVGYERVFKQRRFASAQERALVLDTLAEVGVDSRGLEAGGWLYARLFVSCPLGEADRIGRDLGRDYSEA